jgi:LAO/AO transport system kinase
MKKGIVEICDLIVVTKADGDLLKLAMSTASEYSGALHIARANYGGRSPSVLLASSKSADGLADFWKHVCDFRSMLLESGDLDRIREKHAIYWMWRHLKDLIEASTKSDKNLQKQAQLIEKQLYSETLPPRAAARILYDHIVAQGARKDV